MIAPREPIVTPVPVEELRPTQITVGMREVELKRQMIRAQDARKKTGVFLGRHMVPVVLGPKNRNYVTDHHHLARALIEEGVKDVLVTVIADLVGPQRIFHSVDDAIKSLGPGKPQQQEQDGVP